MTYADASTLTLEIEGRMPVQSVAYPCMNYAHPGEIRYPGQCVGIVPVKYDYCAECVESGNTD